MSWPNAARKPDFPVFRHCSMLPHAIQLMALPV
jgi:hypothetical protein